MRRTLKTLPPCLVAFLLMLTVAFAGNAQELQKKLEGLKGVSGIEKLESDHYAEKYLVRITQPVDHKNPAAGTFTQRVTSVSTVRPYWSRKDMARSMP